MQRPSARNRRFSRIRSLQHHTSYFLVSVSCLRDGWNILSFFFFCHLSPSVFTIVLHLTSSSSFSSSNFFSFRASSIQWARLFSFSEPDLYLGGVRYSPGPDATRMHLRTQVEIYFFAQGSKRVLNCFKPEDLNAKTCEDTKAGRLSARAQRSFEYFAVFKIDDKIVSLEFSKSRKRFQNFWC